jgi:hypothetical protein
VPILIAPLGGPCTLPPAALDGATESATESATEGNTFDNPVQRRECGDNRKDQP